MKAEFTKYGPKHDYRGAHVTLPWIGARVFLGVIKGVYRDDSLCITRAKVDHLCGDPWPFDPALSALEILERD